MFGPEGGRRNLVFPAIFDVRDVSGLNPESEALRRQFWSGVQPSDNAGRFYAPFPATSQCMIELNTDFRLHAAQEDLNLDKAPSLGGTPETENSLLGVSDVATAGMSEEEPPVAKTHRPNGALTSDIFHSLEDPTSAGVCDCPTLTKQGWYTGVELTQSELKMMLAVTAASKRAPFNLKNEAYQSKIKQTMLRLKTEPRNSGCPTIQAIDKLVDIPRIPLSQFEFSTLRQINGQLTTTPAQIVDVQLLNQFVFSVLNKLIILLYLRFKTYHIRQAARHQMSTALYNTCLTGGRWSSVCQRYTSESLISSCPTNFIPCAAQDFVRAAILKAVEQRTRYFRDVMTKQLRLLRNEKH